MTQVEKHRRTYEPSQWNRVIAPVTQVKTLGQQLRKAKQKHSRLLEKYGDRDDASVQTSGISKRPGSPNGR